MKKALVFYLYGTRNAGDMAICVGTIHALRREGYSVTMVSRFSESEDEYYISKDYIEKYFPEVEVFPGPFSFERDFSPIRKLLSYGASFAKVCGLIADKRTRALIEEADVVFFNGGNLLRGENIKDYLRLVALFYPIKMANKAGKTVYCLPQSTAGLSRIGKKLLGSYLKCFSRIYVREQRSYKALRNAFPKLDFKLSTDMAFFCEDSDLARQEAEKAFGDLQGNGRIALVLRNTGIGDIGEIDKRTEDKLLGCLRAFVLRHPEKEYLVIVQTMKDRALSERFAASVKEDISIRLIESHDPQALRELYRHMELMITMRLHAGILALSACTPVVGLFCGDWGLKNPGMMENFGMPYLIADREDKELEGLVAQLPEDAPHRIAHRIEECRELLALE